MGNQNQKAKEEKIRKNKDNKTELEQKLTDHIETVRNREGDIKAECWELFLSWPRGKGAGQLLIEPKKDKTPVQQRGISGEWIESVCLRMLENNWYFHVTREVVEYFVKPLTEPFTCPLYYYIPKEFRNCPTAFISHSWDGFFADIIMFHDRGSNIYWLDIIAINQHDYKGEISKIGDIVQKCNETKLILPGIGQPQEALRPLYRSWCIFEIVQTKDENFRPSIGYIDTDYLSHADVVKEIDNLSVENAQAWFQNDKKTIDELVLKKFGTFGKADELVKTRIKEAFYDACVRYAINNEEKEKHVEDEIDLNSYLSWLFNLVPFEYFCPRTVLNTT